MTKWGIGRCAICKRDEGIRVTIGEQRYTTRWYFSEPGFEKSPAYRAPVCDLCWKSCCDGPAGTRLNAKKMERAILKGLTPALTRYQALAMELE
jgi:hypothetical protein